MTDTPTPPAMTPDKRNLLIQKLRVRQTTISDEVADQLKADGVTIATLTAERDAAQAEIARLTADLATAREDGMREALAILRDVTVERPHFDEARRTASKAIDAAITKGAAI